MADIRVAVLDSLDGSKIDVKKYRHGITAGNLLSTLAHEFFRGGLKDSLDFDIESSDAVVAPGAYRYIRAKEVPAAAGADFAHLQKKERQLQEREGQLRGKEMLYTSGPLALARKDPMLKLLQDIGEIESLPNVDELESFLRRNPLQSGFPISVEYFTRLSDADTTGLFKIGDRDQFCKKLDSHLAKVLYPPFTGTSEGSFHQFWDDLINDFVQLFCKQTIYRDRDTSGDASSGKLRPDVIGVLGSQWALWRAEEKAPSTPGNPKIELIEKLCWCYGGLPYILAYYARGTLVTFTALYMGQGSKRVKDLCTFDLSTIKGRVDIVLACLNVARLLPRLSSLCQDECVEAEFIVLPGRGNGKQVKLYGSSVKKSFHSWITFDRCCK